MAQPHGPARGTAGWPIGAPTARRRRPSRSATRATTTSQGISLSHPRAPFTVTGVRLRANHAGLRHRSQRRASAATSESLNAYAQFVQPAGRLGWTRSSVFRPPWPSAAPQPWRGKSTVGRTEIRPSCACFIVGHPKFSPGLRRSLALFAQLQRDFAFGGPPRWCRNRKGLGTDPQMGRGHLHLRVDGPSSAAADFPSHRASKEHAGAAGGRPRRRARAGAPAARAARGDAGRSSKGVLHLLAPLDGLKLDDGNTSASVSLSRSSPPSAPPAVRHQLPGWTRASSGAARLVCGLCVGGYSLRASSSSWTTQRAGRQPGPRRSAPVRGEVEAAVRPTRCWRTRFYRAPASIPVAEPSTRSPGGAQAR